MDTSEWIKAILSKDASIFEDAYWGPRPLVDDVIPQLIDILNNTQGGYEIGKILELIGESGKIENISILDRYIDNPDSHVSEWARVARDALLRGESWEK